MPNSFMQSEYIRGKLDGQLSEKYITMFQSGRSETDRKFTGKLEDYPMFRQTLQQDYELLWRTEPRTLLKKIANSVDDKVWVKIKSAWVERNPWESLNMIWEILEDEYGDPTLLLNRAIRQLLTETKGVDCNTISLTSFRARLRNLRAVARSIGREHELNKPKLLIKIADLFGADLSPQYRSKFPHPKSYAFEGILTFINEEVDNLRYRERYLKDAASILTEVGSAARKKAPVKTLAVKEVEKKTKQERPQTMDKKGSTTVTGTAKSKKPVSFEDLPQCDFHPSSSAHTLRDCRVFGELSPKEKEKHLKKTMRCFLCFGAHWRRECPEISTAACGHCGKGHHTLLHYTPGGEEQQSKQGPTSNAGSHKRIPENHKTAEKKASMLGIMGTPEQPMETGDASIPIMSLTAVVYGDNGKVRKIIPFYAGIDTGAQRTLCSKHLAEQTGGWDPDDTCWLQFLKGKPEEFVCMKYPLNLKLRSSNQVVSMKEVVFIDTELPFRESIPDREVLEKYQARFPVIAGNRRVDMIMGAPEIRTYGILFSTQWTETCPGGPAVGLHKLGEIWWGLKEDDKSTPCINIVRCIPSEDAPVLENRAYTQMKTMVEDAHGIGADESSQYMPNIYEEVKKYTIDPLILEPNYRDTCPSRDDEKVLKFFEENVEEVIDHDGQTRLQLPLPWKDGPVNTPESRWKAEGSLRTQNRRLERDPETKVKYKEKFDGMFNETHVERVPGEEISPKVPNHRPINYLIHLPTNKKTKFRVVYHGSFPMGKYCINDLLHRGPMFNEPLVNILVRFRQHRYAFCGDIKNMYFQILVHPRDRDMLRVLFYDEEGNIVHYRFRVMPYGLKPMSSIAGFCIRYAARKGIPGASEGTKETLEKSTYVDDILDSCPTLEEAKQRVSGTSSVLGAFGFHVKKWLSNAPEVLSDVPKDDLATGVKDFEPENGEHSPHKTLGVAWLPTTDEMVLKCRPDPSPQDGVLTQVNALSQLNSYYDPLGLWSPFFVRLKKIYSGIAKSVESWTEAVPEEAALKWREAMQELKKHPHPEVQPLLCQSPAGEHI